MSVFEWCVKVSILGLDSLLESSSISIIDSDDFLLESSFCLVTEVVFVGAHIFSVVQSDFFLEGAEVRAIDANLIGSGK